MTLESHSPAALTGQWMAVAATASASPAPVQATAAVDNDRYRQIKELVAAHSKMVPGDVWHVVDARWAAKWKAHMKLDQRSDDDRDYPPPGPLDNSRLQGANELALSKDVVEHRDFILVHDAVWKVLIEQYSGGPDFPRSVVTTGVQQVAYLELHPLIVRVTLVDSLSGEPDSSYTLTAPYSSKQTIADVAESCKACWFPASREMLGEQSPDWRLWHLPAVTSDDAGSPGIAEEAGAAEWIVVPETDLKSPLKKFDSRQDVLEFLFEKRNPSGVWPRTVVERDWRDFRVGDVIDALDTQQKWYESTVRDVKDDQILVHYNNWDSKWDEWIKKDNMTRLAKKGTHTNGPYINTRRMGSNASWTSGAGDVPGPPLARGIVGLRNLGNTCFMNSTLQCLFQCPVLTDFFLDDKHLSQINRSNPLGWQGKIAEAYAQLVKDYWLGDSRIISPRELKHVIGEFQPRFRGYQQQDSQELLNFLLDGLHEDLNRVKDKPQTSPVESGGRSDSVVAEEAWAVHLLRNDSIITDCMQGQVKSTLVCPHCGKICITFDPFMTLTLSLPTNTTTTIPIRVVFCSESRPVTMYGVTVDKSSDVAQLVRTLSETLRAKPDDIVLCDIWNNAIYRIFKSTDLVEEIRSSDEIWAFLSPVTVGPTHTLARSVPETEDIDTPGTEGVASPYGGAGQYCSSPARDFVYVAVNNYMEGASDSSAGSIFDNGDSRKLDAFGIPFVVGLPVGSRVSGHLVRDLVISAAARLTTLPGVSSGLRVVVADRAASGTRPSSKLDGMLIGSDLAEVAISPHTVLNLVWTASQASYFRTDPIVKDSSVVDAHSECDPEPAIDLQQCMGIFTKQEVLAEQDAWFCPSCREFRCASKRLDIWRIPRILAIHLKRFQYSGMWRNKITTMVDFPMTGLTLDDWTPNPAMKGRQYDLFAVSNHFGSLGGGHYTAYVKNLVDGLWYNMDDSMVSRTEPSSVKSEAAYVLFYALRDDEEQRHHV
ncbi:Ubiquitin carboxyl-terminal hydrolase [Plasmodiophora brassicae]